MGNIVKGENISNVKNCRAPNLIKRGNLINYTRVYGDMMNMKLPKRVKYIKLNN